MQWLKQQWNHLRSRTSFRNSVQHFSHPWSALSFRRIHQQENQWLQDWEFQGDQSTSSSRIFGFRMRSRKASSSSRRSELTSILQMFSRNMFPHQFLVNIFLASISSRFILKGQSQFFCQHNQFNQLCSSHPQPPSTSTSPITSTPLSVFMLSVNIDHQEHLRQRLSQASRRIERILTPPRWGSGDQGESSVLRRQHVSHHDSEVQGNQESEAGIIESVQEFRFSCSWSATRSWSSESRVDESVGLSGSDHASVCQCHWAHCHGEEGKIKEGIRRITKRSINDYHIFIFD